MALTVWMGGLPAAAAADEPVPDTPAAAAPAVPNVGDETVTDVTPEPFPSPSPSVVPTSPAEEPTPSTEPTPTPSQEPSSPGTGNDEPQQLGPVSEPTPTSSDEPPAGNGENEQQARPTPQASPKSHGGIRGSGVALLEPASAVIGAYDCQALVVQVTLQNPQDPGRKFSVTAATRSESTWEVIYSEDFILDPGELKVITVPVAADGYTHVNAFSYSETDTVDVSSGDSCGTFEFHPSVTFGQFDCEALIVQVTLDNTGSTPNSAGFELLGYWRGPTIGEAGYLAHDFYGVPAGDALTLSVPLQNDALNFIHVEAEAIGSSGGGTFEAQESCGADPRNTPDAKVLVNTSGCPVEWVNVTIDNMASTLESYAEEFEVMSSTYPDVEGSFQLRLAVDGGTKATVRVPIDKLYGGGIVVLDRWPDETVLYDDAIDPSCGHAVGPPKREAGEAPTSGPTTLAATGAEGMPQLVLGGLLMLTLGGVLLRVGREQRG